MRAFSLLEIIIVILIIIIILSFSLPNFSLVNDNKNLIKLKSEFIFIQNAIEKFKQKKLLLSEDEELESLDKAISLKNGEKLFSNILKTSFISTNDQEKKVGFWLKRDKNNYEFLLSSSKTIKFKYKNGLFKCYDSEVCKDLE